MDGKIKSHPELANLGGEVPTLRHGQYVITNMMDIINYIDQEFGKPNTLFPTHKKLAKNTKYIQSFIKYTFPWCFYPMLLSKDEEVQNRCK